MAWYFTYLLFSSEQHNLCCIHQIKVPNANAHDRLIWIAHMAIRNKYATAENVSDYGMTWGDMKRNKRPKFLREFLPACLHHDINSFHLFREAKTACISYNASPRYISYTCLRGVVWNCFSFKYQMLYSICLAWCCAFCVE